MYFWRWRCLHPKTVLPSPRFCVRICVLISCGWQWFAVDLTGRIQELNSPVFNHLRTSVEDHGSPQKHKMQRETRPAITLHHLESSTFSPPSVRPMYSQMYFFGEPARPPSDGRTMEILSDTSCSAHGYPVTVRIRQSLVLPYRAPRVRAATAVYSDGSCPGRHCSLAQHCSASSSWRFCSSCSLMPTPRQRSSRTSISSTSSRAE